ncbi:MAG: CHAT domain-containing protein, partial [Myxococcota bacterium]
GALRSVTVPVAIEDVQAQIPPGAALVEMVEYDVYDPAPPPGESAWGPKQLAAFVLPSQGEPRWVPLGETAAISESVGAFRAALVKRTLPLMKLRARGQDLYERLITPLESHLKGVGTLLLAPDGVLNLVSFGALIDSEGKYLVERYELTYLTSGRDLLRTRPTGASSSPALVIAAPEYDRAVPDMTLASSPDTRRSRQLGSLQWGALPGTKLEGLSVAKTLGVSALTGAGATETAIRTTEAPRVLHIATHGFFLADQEIETPETRAMGGGLSAEGNGSIFGRPLSTENPLLRSGLVLAGANVAPVGSDDGILTALEMAGLDLWGTRLVVLSACETAVGQVAVGEGVYGMRRALVIAGAAAQLASLWKVSDYATKELMTAYYERLLAGEGRSEALRNVQLAMLANPARSRPYYWASFIPIGDRGPVDLGVEQTNPKAE